MKLMQLSGEYEHFQINPLYLLSFVFVISGWFCSVFWAWHNIKK